MAQTCEARRAVGGAAGPMGLSCGEADNSKEAHNTPGTQARNPAAVAAMQRGGIRIHAELAQTFAEIGDPAGVCYALRRLFAHAKAVHPVFIELRDEASSGEEASQ